MQKNRPKLALFGILTLLMAAVMSSCSSHQDLLRSGPRFSIERGSESHSSVRYWQRNFTKNGHVATCLKRGEPILQDIQEILIEEGVPWELSFLPVVESCFDPEADSGKARGLWQFTEPTAEAYGLDVGWFFDDRDDWELSTRAAARYLKRLNRRFDGNWLMALAAYNAGPTYVARKIRQHRTKRFWHLRPYLYRETQNYVPQFLGTLLVVKSMKDQRRFVAIR